jgi:hypothetical protein
MFDPQRALLDLLQPGGTNQTLFPPTSRYCGIPTSTILRPGGVAEIYLRRRFLPLLGAMLALEGHSVVQGERLDHIAFKYLADPEQFWRIADANSEMDAAKLTATPGRRLHIPLGSGA